MCESNGYCSFPDEDCTSGRRYGQMAPSELAGVCVGGEAGSTGAESSGGSEGTGTDASSSTTTSAMTTGTLPMSTGSGDSSSTGEPPPEDPANYVFVASQTVPKNQDVVAAADTVCNTLALKAGLEGTYVSWLSTTKTSAIDRLAGARGWVRPDGKPVADRPIDIVEGRIFYPPVLDELGTEVRNRSAMTGTSSDGTLQNNCADWTVQAEDLVSVGVPGATFPGWTGDRSEDCSQSEPLVVYCFGIDLSVPVTFEPVEGRRAFVTAGTLDGTGGLESFDDLCTSEAAGGGLEGSFLAVIAMSTASGLSRFDTAGPTWVNGFGVPLAETALALTVQSHLDAPANITVAGEAVGGYYWTGATSPTGLGVSNCTDWTGEASGRRDEPDHTTDWFDGASANCTSTSRVLCFEE